MGYTYNCDGCGEGYNSFPPFAGEFTEEFLNTLGGKFAKAYKPGQKVTFCADCMELYVLAGQLLVCRRCGFTERADEFPAGEDECPKCERSEWNVRQVEPDEVPEND